MSMARSCSLLVLRRGFISLGRKNRVMAASSWNYDNQDVWGTVKGWEVASTGKRQSPIDIDTRAVMINKSLKPLLLQGWNNSLSGSIQNTGHSIQFTPSTLNQPLMVAHNGSYSLSQFHIHWGASAEEGSEHTIDGKSYSGEIHFVLRKSTGPDDAGDALSVLAVFCEANINMKIRGTPWENLCIPQDYHQICLTDSLVPSKFLPSNQDFYHYPGSLTTPPCSEIVMWYIFKQAIKIPIEFLFSLRQIQDEKNESLQYNHRCPKFNHNYPVETPDLEK